MNILITESQLNRIICEQSFYAPGCRPTYREDPHGHAYKRTSVKNETHNGRYANSKAYANKLLPELKKKDRWQNEEYETAKQDLYKSMDVSSRQVYDKLQKEKHPLYYYLVQNFATIATNRVTKVVPKYYNNPHSIEKVTKYKYTLENWVTKLNDLGNDDYSWTYNYDVVLKTEGTD